MAIALAGSVKVPYKKYPSPSGFSYRAVLDVYISLPSKNSIRSKKLEAVIDSGANDFHAQVGEKVGFDVKSGKSTETYGVDGKASTIYFYDLYLFAPGGIIQINGAFSYDLPVIAILGMSGFFDHFKITFDPTSRRFELELVYQA